LFLLLGTTSVPPLEAQAATVVLVRHAEKAASGGDPELSAMGLHRAGELARALDQFTLSAILVSQYRRTLQTAESTAVAQHLTPLPIPAGADLAAHGRAVVAAVRQAPAGSAVLVVGHSNTLGPIIAALGGPRIPDLCDDEYSTLLVVELSGRGEAPRLLRASYGAPDRSDAQDCHHGMRLPHE
jgi:broad specificity phosphatase PhoE